VAGPGANPLQAVGLVYAVVLVLVSAWLWRTGRFSRPVGYGLLLLTVLLGFAIFSPMLPHQFQTPLLQLGGSIGAGIAGVVAAIALLIVLSFLVGRQFCGSLCPIGAVQELAYLAPVPKVKITRVKELSVVRAVVLLLILGAAIGAGTAVLSIFGIREFFTLTVSAAFFAFVAVIAVSLIFYRPFCRIICPLGALFQIAAVQGRWRLRRTDACVACGRCERACPTGDAGAPTGECYFCRRCVEACHVDGALVYSGAAKDD
jgi:polyferredoxin